MSSEEAFTTEWHNNRVRRLVFLALLAACATGLQILEAPLPRPLPWMKIGLANSTTLAAVLLYGLEAAVLLVIVRQTAAHLLMGTLFAPSFFLGLAGAVSAALAMTALLSAFRDSLGLVSISSAGALANNLGQLYTASILLGHQAVWFQLPLMLTAALPSGVLVGLLTSLMLARIPGREKFPGN